MAKLRYGWKDIRPRAELRTKAEMLLRSNSLRAGDALQLAAAWTWSSGAPQGRVFIAGDTQLLEAARKTGFQTVPA